MRYSTKERHNWLDAALDRAIRNLAARAADREAIVGSRLPGIGIPPAKFRQLEADVNTIDFSGWLLITHCGLSNDLAYSICQAIDSRQSAIPVDDDNPLDMRTDLPGKARVGAGIPLHSLAPSGTTEEKGYL